MLTVLLDDEVKRTLDAAASVAGFPEGNAKYNAVIRRLLKLPDMGKSADDEAPKGVSSERLHSVDQLVLDQSLRGTKPIAIYGPDGESSKLTHWSDVLTSIADWLVDNGHVQSDMPATTGYRKHPLISKDRQKLSHPDVAKQVQGGWWIETWGNVNTKGRNLRLLLRSAGVDLTQFRVGVSKP